MLAITYMHCHNSCRWLILLAGRVSDAALPQEQATYCWQRDNRHWLRYEITSAVTMMLRWAGFAGHYVERSVAYDIKATTQYCWPLFTLLLTYGMSIRALKIRELAAASALLMARALLLGYTHWRRRYYATLNGYAALIMALRQPTLNTPHIRRPNRRLRQLPPTIRLSYGGGQ